MLGAMAAPEDLLNKFPPKLSHGPRCLLLEDLLKSTPWCQSTAGATRAVSRDMWLLSQPCLERIPTPGAGKRVIRMNDHVVKGMGCYPWGKVHTEKWVVSARSTWVRQQSKITSQNMCKLFPEPDSKEESASQWTSKGIQMDRCWNCCFELEGLYLTAFHRQHLQQCQTLHLPDTFSEWMML